MKDLKDERTTTEKPFSYEKMKFRYKLASKLINSGNVLDIGCGYAYGRKYIKNENYTGIDYYLPAIQQAQQKYPKDVFFKQELPSLNFESESFDNILCLEVIEHILEDDAKILIEEIHRVLKTSGILVISTPNSKNKEGLWKDHIKEYTPEELKQLFGDKFHLIRETGFLDSFCWKLLQGLGNKNKISTEKRTGLRSKSKFKRLIIRALAWGIVRVGYYRPKAAIHQAYVLMKKS